MKTKNFKKKSLMIKLAVNVFGVHINLKRKRNEKLFDRILNEIMLLERRRQRNKRQQKKAEKKKKYFTFSIASTVLRV